MRTAQPRSLIERLFIMTLVVSVGALVLGSSFHIASPASSSPIRLSACSVIGRSGGTQGQTKLRGDGGHRRRLAGAPPADRLRARAAVRRVDGCAAGWDRPCAADGHVAPAQPGSLRIGPASPLITLPRIISTPPLCSGFSRTGFSRTKFSHISGRSLFPPTECPSRAVL